MKKRIISLCLVVCLLAVAIVGGTMAYFTDTTDAVTNAITIGNVDIQQHELTRSDNGLAAFSGDLKLIPSNLTVPTGGDANMAHENINGVRTAFLDPEKDDTTNVVDKIVQVQNTGDVNAYVGTLFAYEDTNDVSKYFTFVNGGWAWKTMKDSNGKIIQIKDTNGTVYSVGCYVNTGVVAPQGFAVPGLTQVLMKSTATQESVKDAGDTYDIICVSFGVQADGFDSANDAVKAALGIELNSTHGRYQATKETLAKFFPGYTIGYYDSTTKGFVAY